MGAVRKVPSTLGGGRRTYTMAGSSTGALGGQKSIRMGGEPCAGARDPAGWDGPQQGTHPEWVSEPEEGEEVAHRGWYRG